MSNHNEPNKRREKLKPFTNISDQDNFCVSCKYRVNCEFLQFVNKLAIKRDGIAADDRWGCTLYVESE